MEYSYLKMDYILTHQAAKSFNSFLHCNRDQYTFFEICLCSSHIWNQSSISWE